MYSRTSKPGQLLSERDQKSRRDFVNELLATALMVVGGDRLSQTRETPTISAESLLNVEVDFENPFTITDIVTERLVLDAHSVDPDGGTSTIVHADYMALDAEFPFQTLGHSLITAPANDTGSSASADTLEKVLDEIGYHTLGSEVMTKTQRLIDGYRQFELYNSDPPSDDGTGRGDDLVLIQELPDGVLVTQGSTSYDMRLRQTGHAHTRAILDTAQNAHIDVSDPSHSTVSHTISEGQ